MRKTPSSHHQSTAVIDAAVELAERGWRVLPCRELGDRAKTPYLRHGHKDASTSPVQINEWWRRWPCAMVGAVVPSELVVLDVDPRNGGTMGGLAEVLGPLPETLMVWSGRRDGGRHLYYRRPSGRLTARTLPRGVDLKLDTGYLIMPPSRHPVTGLEYSWETRMPAILPPRAARLLRVPTAAVEVGRCVAQFARGTARMEALVRQVLTAEVGNRNDRFFWACCRAVESGARTLADLQPLVGAAHQVGLTGRRASGYTEAETAAFSALSRARRFR